MSTTISPLTKDQIVKSLTSLKPLTLNIEYTCWPQVTTTSPHAGTETYEYKVRVFSPAGVEVTTANFTKSYSSLANVPVNPWSGVADLILAWRSTIEATLEVNIA